MVRRVSSGFRLACKCALMATFADIVARANNLLSTVRWVRQQLAAGPNVSNTAINSMISQSRRALAIEIGGSLSEYLIGKRELGSRAARAAVDQHRRLTSATIRVDQRVQALSLLDQVAALVSELSDPIDWRIRRHLTLSIAKAKSASRSSTILDKSEALLLELIVYSPPEDDISIVRDSDRKFRDLIERRLSAIDPDWWRTRVQPRIFRRAEKAALHRSARGSAPSQFLLFADYGAIILDPSNWRLAFESDFHDRDSFRSCFNELRALRNDVAHSRLLSTTDRIRMREIMNRLLAPIVM
jgi:Swt1-like HEPN